MGCCKVAHCCCCIDLPVGVRILCFFLVFVEIILMVIAIQFAPQFIFFAVPTCSLGIACHITAILAITFGLHRDLSRWFLLPWLIYIMILVVGLVLTAILLFVIPVGDLMNLNFRIYFYWPILIVSAWGCLVAAGLYLYFWIVVLELFVRMGPFYDFNGIVFSQVPPIPTHQMEQGQHCQVYQPYQQTIYRQNGQHVLVPVNQMQLYGHQQQQQQLQQQQQQQQRLQEQ